MCGGVFDDGSTDVYESAALGLVLEGPSYGGKGWG